MKSFSLVERPSNHLEFKVHRIVDGLQDDPKCFLEPGLVPGALFVRMAANGKGMQLGLVVAVDAERYSVAWNPWHWPDKASMMAATVMDLSQKLKAAGWTLKQGTDL